ncbi:MAG: hypothetical protein WC313_04205 [Candidatus Kapaibacterium sp.]
MLRLIFTALIIIMCSCTLQKEAFVFIKSKTPGRTQEGLYYMDVSIKNTGEQPAYFVILIAQAFKNGNDIQRVEKGFGDIFPNAEKEMRVTFDRIGFTEPDSVTMKITYSPYHL